MGIFMGKLLDFTIYRLKSTALGGGREPADELSHRGPAASK